MNAEGRTDAPLLVVLSHQPSEGMDAWMKKILFDEGKILPQDTRFVYMLDDPPKSSGGRSTKEQMRGSWDRFTTEIRESKPSVVLCLGSEPLYWLTGIKEDVQQARGYVIRKKFFRDIEWQVNEQIGVYKTSNKARGITKGDPKYGYVTKNFPGLLGGQDFDGVVIPAFQLDHIRTSGFAVSPAFRVDVQRAKRALDGQLRMIDEDIKYSTMAWCVNPKELKEIIAIDIETIGIDNDVIERVSISDGEITASIPWDLNALKLLNEIFSRTDVLFALHNSGFDLPRLRQHGVRITQHVLDHQIFDTMYGAVVLQPDLLKGLGAAATIYLDLEPWKWRSLIEADPVYYSAKDAYVTSWLARQEMRVMKNMGEWNLTMGLANHPGPGIMATIPILTEAHHTGIKTNREYANWWVGKLKRRLFRLEMLWTRMFGGINPHSTKQLQSLLYTTWGLPVQRTKKESLTSDELALVKLKYYVVSDYAMIHDSSPWKDDKRCNPRTFDLLLAIRDASKLISTYVQPVALNEEHRVYPSYLPASKDSERGEMRGPDQQMRSKGNTATGRLATFKPNIGNQPKEVRKIYIPDTPTDCFIQADWKAAELCVFAWTAGDERLIDDLKSDIHSRNAERFGVPRPTAKNVMYAKQYLAGPSKVNEMILAQEHLYVPVEECKRIMMGMDDYYYKTTALKHQLISLCATQKYVQNPFGRIRTFPSGEAPAAVDFWAQSIVADCLWCVLKEVADMAKTFHGHLVTTVYDSVLIQVPSVHVEAASKRLREIMERKFDIVAPGFYIPTELEVGAPGKSWGELKKT